MIEALNFSYITVVVSICLFIVYNKGKINSQNNQVYIESLNLHNLT